VDFSYLEIPTFQRALLAGSLLAALLALLGVLVTARGLSYLGDGLSHAAFGGIALGMFIGVASPLWVAIPFTALAAIAIGTLRRRGGLRSDVAMAILFASCFAAGVILLHLHLRQGKAGTLFDPEQLLFGNILLVGSNDLYLVIGIAIVTAAFFAVAWTRVAYATFDEDLARLSGIPVGWLESALLAAVVVAAIRLAGVVLVSAFLVIPAATGKVVGRSLSRVVGLAMLSGIFGVFSGFDVANRLEWPAGATIVLSLAAQFLLAVVFRKARS
jgi:zinc transport system permease protein